MLLDIVFFSMFLYELHAMKLFIYSIYNHIYNKIITFKENTIARWNMSELISHGFVCIIKLVPPI